LLFILLLTLDVLNHPLTLDVLNHPFFSTAPLPITAETFAAFDENGT
jgi:hypothetical protein